jgi:8-oxo-dGTP diphosphatase
MVEVAAAVIERADGAFLLAQRPAGKVYAGWWEFPGGKADEGESAEAALVRELHEELGIDVERAYPWITRVFAYPHATVRLHFFRVAGWIGEPHPKEGQAFFWQRLDAPIVQPMLPANAPVLRSLALPLEYAITDAESLGAEQMLEQLERRLGRGLRLIQVRDKALADRIQFARSVVALAHRYGAKVLVNGDERSARSAGADGVHWSAALLGRAERRPEGLLCGASCHTPEEVRRAAALECDFAVLGPVRDTTTHPGTPALGCENFVRIARGAPMPVFAIGGVLPSDLDEARRHGAHGLAMIRGSWS